MNTTKPKGFTLIELLVVVAIIGILATVVLASLGSAREKASDSKRLTVIRQIEQALEMYFIDNGSYPNLYAYTCCGSGVAANTNFENVLAPYLSVDLTNASIFGDVSNPNDNFYYQSRHDNNQSYGMMISLLSSGNSSLLEDDGGSYPQFYEVGQRPQYCKNTHDEGWLNPPGTALCSGGGM